MPVGSLLIKSDTCFSSGTAEGHCKKFKADVEPDDMKYTMKGIYSTVCVSVLSVKLILRDIGRDIWVLSCWVPQENRLRTGWILVWTIDKEEIEIWLDSLHICQ